MSRSHAGPASLFVGTLYIQTRTPLSDAAAPDDTRVQMKVKFKGVGEEWATKLDSRGKPASEALKEFNDLLAEGAAKK